MEDQYYNLLRQLQSHINHEDELGSIIGYTVLNSLLTFESDTGSQEELMFEQVKAIQSGLRSTLEQCREEGSYNALCDLINDTDHHYTGIQAEDKVTYGLGYEVLKCLEQERGSYEDLLRRKGLRLYKSVIKKSGPLDGRKNALMKDYYVTQSCFTEKR